METYLCWTLQNWSNRISALSNFTWMLRIKLKPIVLMRQAFYQWAISPFFWLFKQKSLVFLISPYSWFIGLFYCFFSTLCYVVEYFLPISFVLNWQITLCRFKVSDLILCIFIYVCIYAYVYAFWNCWHTYIYCERIDIASLIQ